MQKYSQKAFFFSAVGGGEEEEVWGFVSYLTASHIIMILRLLWLKTTQMLNSLYLEHNFWERNVCGFVRERGEGSIQDTTLCSAKTTCSFFRLLRRGALTYFGNASLITSYFLP